MPRSEARRTASTYPQIEVRPVEDWAVHEFGDSTTMRLAAGELVAYSIALTGPEGELERYPWPQAERPGFDKIYTTPFDIPEGELFDLAADMWTDVVAEVGAPFEVGGRTVTICEIEHDDRGTDGCWKTGYVLAAAAGEKPVRYRLDQLAPKPGAAITVTEFVNAVSYGANFNRDEE
ncbi:hypothetical protein [Kitasatospora sp. NPDC098663]|uniref:hypothetical protein n=1 Tax=Kitasatospora sp. NPDC098663 TaxID=3364096 RepID=UPI003818E882